MTRKSRPKAASTPAQTRSWLPKWAVLALAVGGAAAIATCTLLQGRSPSEPPLQTERGVADSIVMIDYRVSAHDWPDVQPTLCAIVDRYELGDSARRATLYLNGHGGECAAPTTTARLGSRIRIAVWAPAEFNRCSAEAIACR